MCLGKKETGMIVSVSFLFFPLMMEITLFRNEMNFGIVTLFRNEMNFGIVVGRESFCGRKW